MFTATSAFGAQGSGCRRLRIEGHGKNLVSKERKKFVDFLLGSLLELLFSF